MPKDYQIVKRSGTGLKIGAKTPEDVVGGVVASGHQEHDVCRKPVPLVGGQAAVPAGHLVQIVAVGVAGSHAIDWLLPKHLLGDLFKGGQGFLSNRYGQPHCDPVGARLVETL